MGGDKAGKYCSDQHPDNAILIGPKEKPSGAKRTRSKTFKGETNGHTEKQRYRKHGDKTGREIIKTQPR